MNTTECGWRAKAHMVSVDCFSSFHSCGTLWYMNTTKTRSGPDIFVRPVRLIQVDT
jgi:hypothetical protein